MNKNVEASCNSQITKCQYCGKPYVPRSIPFLGTQKIINEAACDCLKKQEEARQRKVEQEARQRSIKKLYSISNLGPKFMKRTFENWEQRPGTENAYNAALNFIDDFKRPSGLCLIGNPRTGKTHLAAAITHKLIESGKTCIFLNINEFLYRINNKDYNSDYYITKVIDKLKSADLVILNDLGKENYTEAKEANIFTILDVIENWEISLIVTMNIEATAKFDKTETLKAAMGRIRTICGQNIYEVKAESYYN